MTKQDHAKMEARLTVALPIWISGRVLTNIKRFVASEITRAVAKAVRAERRAQRDTEELWASHRRRADEQTIERAQGLGRKRT